MLKKLLLLSMLFYGVNAKALPIVNADAFVEGDGRAALEVSTGIVWMDFGITHKESFNSVLSKLDTTYKGWRLPTLSEVTHLVTSFTLPHFETYYRDSHGDIDYEYDSWGEANSTFYGIYEAFGYNLFERGSRSIIAEGYFLDNNDKLALAVIDGLDARPWHGDMLVLSINSQHESQRDAVAPDDESTYSSTLLVKTTWVKVPEPSAFLLLLLGMIGLIFNRSRLK